MSVVLLDLDGTLTDSRPGIIASIEAALRTLGHVRDRAIDLSHVVGPPLEAVMAEVLTPYGDQRVAEAVAAYRQHYAAYGLLDSAVYTGVADMLTAARRSGRRLYLATSKRNTLARRVLEHFALIDNFAGVYGSEPGGGLDDKAALIRHVLARAVIAPDEAVMVGDRRHDVEGAHANGMRAIGVLWGYGGHAELAAAGADALVASPAALISHEGWGAAPTSPVRKSTV
jgi:phosphoglycolate phosphatase